MRACVLLVCAPMQRAHQHANATIDAPMSMCDELEVSVTAVQRSPRALAPYSVGVNIHDARLREHKVPNDKRS